jgi:5-methylcytosine-specific restriction endonuclease McrA
MDLTACPLAHGDNIDGLCSWCGSRLPRGRARWCSDDCSHAWAENHIWTTARKARLKRDAHRCSICGSTDALHVHHDPPVNPRIGYRRSCAHHQDRLRTLCAAHHVAVHVAMRAPAGTVTQLAMIAA